MSNVPDYFFDQALLASISALGLLLLVMSSGFDLALRKIPNAMVVLIAPLGLLRHGLAGDLLPALGAALAVFVLAIVAWRKGMLGGADVKLMAAAALLVPLDMVPVQLLVTTLAGGVLAMIVIALRPYAVFYATPAGPDANLLTRLWRIEAWRLRHGGSLPYVVAITAGTAAAIWSGGV